jgi:hypothetical protein
MHHINRPHRPNAEMVDFIYEAYLLLYRAPCTFGKWARQGAMENIAACTVSWRPIGISENALRKIGSSRSNVGTKRGHWYTRERRYEDLFGVCQPLSRADLISHFYDHDTTVVITKEQNDTGLPCTAWGKIIPVPDGLFTTRGYSFAVRKRTELPWIDARIAELDQTI